MRRLLLGLTIAAIAAWSLLPFAWSIVTSLKSETDLGRLLPSEPTLANYPAIFERQPFGRYLLNSVLVAAGSTLLAVAVGSLAAYALARLRFRRAALIERTLLVFALVPPAILIVPLFSSARALGLVNSYVGLIIVHAALNLPFVIWSLASFFRELPPELEDAARVDGFSRFAILWRIVLPCSGPAVAATAVLAFIFSWNEFVIALTLLSSPSMRTVPVGISMLSGSTAYEIPWSQVSAAVVLTTLPVVAVVLALQRWIVSGLTSGAVKG